MYKSAAFGISASFTLLLLYFTVMTLAQASFAEAFQQLQALRLWIIPLVLSFGIQVGLYMYIKDCNIKQSISGKATAINTATSGTAMIACCAHHITDILPIIGLSVFSTFLARYQAWFFGISIILNGIGIGILIKQLRKIKKHEI